MGCCHRQEGVSSLLQRRPACSGSAWRRCAGGSRWLPTLERGQSAVTKQPSRDHRSISEGRADRGASPFSPRFLWIPLATLLIAACFVFFDGSSTNVASQQVDYRVSGSTDFVPPRSGLLAKDPQGRENRSLSRVEPAPARVLATFLDGRSVATVMLTAATPRQPGLPFEARPKSAFHELPDFDDMKAD